MIDLSWLDLLVIAVYLLSIVVLGLWVGRGERNATDYFLAGRSLPWYLIGLSFYASNMSGASFVGLMGAAYEEGMVVFNYEWTATVVLIVFALTMLPAFLRAKLFTLPEYLERRFDRRCRWSYAALTIATLLFIDMAGAIFAGSVVVTTLFPAIGLWQSSVAIALLTGAYTLFGGLRSVVVTDALQAVLIIAGAALICGIGLSEVGGWSGLTASLDSAQSNLFRPANDGFLPWPGIGGILLLGFYYWALNQYFAQRALAARSLREGQRGLLFAGLLKLPNLFLMILPGMVAAVLLPDLESPDQAFPALIARLLPEGLRGLILTALLAAIMSSLDSALNAAASLVTMDFVRPLRPALSGRALLRIGRLSTAVFILIAALYAPVIERFGSLFQYFQSTLAYIVPPVVAVYLGGLFSSRISAAGAFAGLTGGLAMGLALFLVKELLGLWGAIGLPDVHFTYMAMAIFALTLAIMTAVGRSRDGTTATTLARAQRSDLSAGSGGLADSRLMAAALALLLVVVLAALA
jgi:SSS family solute:Na+ symporter